MLFRSEEKVGRAQIKKCEQNFSVVWRALASGGGAGQFRSKWVRAKFRIEHQDKNKTCELLVWRHWCSGSTRVCGALRRGSSPLCLPIKPRNCGVKFLLNREGILSALHGHVP